jgi:hypothetical protein
LTEGGEEEVVEMEPGVLESFLGMVGSKFWWLG